MYQTMKIGNLAGLIPFFDFSVVEKIPVDAIKLKFLSMKVDHMKNVVIFCNTSLEDDGLKDHLASFAEQFYKAREMICPPDRKQSKLGALLPTLSEVVAKEHKRLLARKSIIDKRNPKFLVIVEQKNHHTKFFQPGSPDNVPPGTLVDNKICHPRNYDFNLCAHTGMIGTSRPTHYHVLLDHYRNLCTRSLLFIGGAPLLFVLLLQSAMRT